MNIPSFVPTKIAAAMVLAAGLGLGTHAEATPLLTFGQTSALSTITATNDIADTTTTIIGTAVNVDVTSYLAGGTPFNTTLNLSLNSVGAITDTFGILIQQYSGSVSFTTGGTNYLTAVFTDALFAISGASSLTIAASQPPGSIVFTSSVLPASDFNDPLAISLSFANVSPPASVAGSTLGAFTSTISGTSSTTLPVPEPASLTLLGAGLTALGVARRRRQATT